MRCLIHGQMVHVSCKWFTNYFRFDVVIHFVVSLVACVAPPVVVCSFARTQCPLFVMPVNPVRIQADPSGAVHHTSGSSPNSSLFRSWHCISLYYYLVNPTHQLYLHPYMYFLLHFQQLIQLGNKSVGNKSVSCRVDRLFDESAAVLCCFVCTCKWTCKSVNGIWNVARHRNTISM